MTRTTEKYDYIIAGAGSSGLSLAWHLLHSPLGMKKILIADSSFDPDLEDEKTWCFWFSGDPPFRHLIRKKWKKASVGFESETIVETLKTYPYYCISSGDYRTDIITRLREHSHSTLVEGTITRMRGNKKKAFLTAGDHTFEADYIFQSCFRPRPSGNNADGLTQHFLGWDIRTNEKTFDPEIVTLMDFDQSLSGRIGFMYILPWSNNKALLEYTLFSPRIEEAEFYEEKLRLYLHNRFGLKPFDYHILRKEQGEIPMVSRSFDPWYADRVMNLGIAGGVTKPSTGYTFARIHQHSAAIVASLLEKGRPVPPGSALRYRLYDRWLLQILRDHPGDAIRIFHQLFSNNSFDEVFRFLGETTTIAQDLKIMKNVPALPFFRAMWKTGFKS